MLLIQHQLGNQVLQAEALIRLGVLPEQLYWLDIPYTANAEVRRQLTTRVGIPEKNLHQNNYKVLSPYASYQRHRSQEILRKFLDDPPERLVVLDDGAYFIEAMVSFKKKLPQVAIVEQTTRGLIKIEGNAAFRLSVKELPLIDVASSVPKKTLEPPFIGFSVCEALHRKLKEKGLTASGTRCLVTGFGAIGRQVAHSLVMRGFQKDHIYIFDTKKKSLKEAASLGYKLWNKDDHTTFHLVVGCSGRSSFGVGDYVFLEHPAILASASSGSVELSREDFIELAASHRNDDIYLRNEKLDEEDIHSDLEFRIVDRDVTFVNGGFPVNFDGRINCVPAHYIQPTVAMMVEASVQAAQTKRKGVIGLRPSFCNWVREEFKKELGDESSVVDMNG